jgi:hypothetical protein
VPIASGISRSLTSVLHIAEFCQRRGAGTKSLASGLSKRLRPVGGHDIGSFSVVQEEPLTVSYNIANSSKVPGL